MSALKWQRGATVDSSLGVSPTRGVMPRTRSACYVFGLVAEPIHFPCHSPVQFSSPLPRLAADGSPATISEPRDRVYAAFVRTERLCLLLGTRSLPRLRRLLGRVHARQAHFHFSPLFFFKSGFFYFSLFPNFRRFPSSLAQFSQVFPVCYAKYLHIHVTTNPPICTRP